MRLNFQPAALLFFILLKYIVNMVSAGLNIKPIKVSRENSVSVLEVTDPIAKLMGMEDCNNGDEEECFKRRMTMEAHLDYIYTQHHKP